MKSLKFLRSEQALVVDFSLFGHAVEYVYAGRRSPRILPCVRRPIVPGARVVLTLQTGPPISINTRGRGEDNV